VLRDGITVPYLCLCAVELGSVLVIVFGLSSVALAQGASDNRTPCLAAGGTWDGTNQSQGTCTFTVTGEATVYTLVIAAHVFDSTKGWKVTVEVISAQVWSYAGASAPTLVSSGVVGYGEVLLCLNPADREVYATNNPNCIPVLP
jgi:hypothetical protein